MTELTWNEPGSKNIEAGVSKGVLYHADNNGNFLDGEAWQGLTGITKSPTGGEATKQYADNQAWMTITSAEYMGLTLECLQYPKGFERYDGLVELAPGVVIGQQPRSSFGLCWRTEKINDVQGEGFGYKLHFAWGCRATPSEAAHSTIGESTEPTPFSYTIDTTPVPVPGFRPTAYLSIDSNDVSPSDLAALEQTIYGAEGVDPAMPTPASIAAMMGGVVRVTPTKPTNVGNAITIPTVTGVVYYIDNEIVAAGVTTITEDTVVEARPADGYAFTTPVDDDWFYDYTP